MRRCIYATFVRHSFESKDRGKYWKKLSVQYLERYIFLINFNFYLHETIKQSNRKLTYSKWYQSNQKLHTTVGTIEEGPLSKFNWD